MNNILSNLSSLGLENLGNEKLFETEEDIKQRLNKAEKKVTPTVEEKDLVYDKAFTCPVCDKKFVSKVMKSGKTRMLVADLDLRPRFEGIDPNKYDVVVCEHCGYSVLGRFFAPLAPTLSKSIKERVCDQIKVPTFLNEIYSFEEALNRYQLALACAVVKHVKNSEKAYICLKMAWLYRGQREELEENRQLLPKQREELLAKETEYLTNALEGFKLAREMENGPICGMDSATFDYLIAAVAYEVNNLPVAANIISELLTKQGVNVRIKDKARDLKDLILAKKKSE